MKRILIVEDLPSTREWLGAVARHAFPGCEIHEAASVFEGCAACAGFELALIDLCLPDGTGLDVLRSLRKESPDMLCVITTVIGDDAKIVAALSAGANGYLMKEQSEELLSRQLRQLVDGVPALSPSIARRLMDHFCLTGPSDDADTCLSDREKETLALIARGFRNKDAAEHLGISESTVATHIRAIYRKLGINSRAEASWHATRLGL